MKKILLLISIVLASFCSFAQVTDTQLKNITISDHPTKGLDRRADLVSFYWCAKDSFIQTKYYVYELDLNGNRDVFSRYEVSLYASNQYLVNPATGALLMTKAEYDTLPVNDRPASVMGEYNFFLLYAQNPIKLYELLLAKAIEADVSRQRFNR